ncbi:hypothetical protein [Methylorubrum extorquens]|uniref:Uncharacterized protein n=1 Tax=Methylorubrum extorquens TaxID=408 RepID=A0AAX3WDC8_METEX|nr:hypothetical protein [Methylorubrum extorquens]WHQ68635.1 hypothetical protein KEC54_20030 [Methylorubrum extorquens]
MARRKPRLVADADAGKVAKHSWSVRINLVSFVLTAVETGLSVLTGSPPIDPVPFAVLIGVTSLAAAGARFVAQSCISGDA